MTIKPYHFDHDKLAHDIFDKYVVADVEFLKMDKERAIKFVNRLINYLQEYKKELKEKDNEPCD